MAKKRPILIVDDEMEIREILRRVLEPTYEIHEAASGKEALRRVQNEEFDVVTLDLSMPEISGIEVLKEIKRIKPGVEVVIVSGYGTLSKAKEAINYGAAGFISKPFNVADILSVIAKSYEKPRG